MPPRRAPSPLRSVSGERPASGSRLRAPPSPSAAASASSSSSSLGGSARKAIRANYGSSSSHIRNASSSSSPRPSHSRSGLSQPHYATSLNSSHHHDENEDASRSTTGRKTGSLSLNSSFSSSNHGKVNKPRDKAAVQVCVRIRPLEVVGGERRRENANHNKLCWRYDTCSVAPSSSMARDESSDSNGFTFDNVFAPMTTTEQIYKSVVSEIVQSTVDGYNGCIFAYGQTSSGKTFTMTGSRSSPGVIPLAASEVFSHVRKYPEREFFFRLSYIEIYNEVVIDLLDPTKTGLQIRQCSDQSAGGVIKIMGVTEKVVTSVQEVMTTVQSGEGYRSTGQTDMNEKSSRSHTIFRLVVESRSKDSIGGVGEYRVSSLNLVDLAGSESASKAGSDGVRRTEGSYINKSLLTLATVIQRLITASGHIPYRDSKLTRILEPALGGNSRTAVICTITPAAQHYTESLNTLKFAARAKRMKNRPILNDVTVSGGKEGDDVPLLKKYRDEIESLRREKEDLEHQNQQQRNELESEKEQVEESKMVLMEKIERYESMIVDLDSMSRENSKRQANSTMFRFSRSQKALKQEELQRENSDRIEDASIVFSKLKQHVTGFQDRLVLKVEALNQEKEAASKESMSKEREVAEFCRSVDTGESVVDEGRHLKLLNQVVGAVKNEIKIKDELLAQLTADIKNDVATFEGLQDDFNRLETSLRSQHLKERGLESILKNHYNKVRDQDERMVVLEQQNQELSEVVNSKMDALKIVEEQIYMFVEELEEQRGEVHARKAEVSRLQKQLSQAQSEISDKDEALRALQVGRREELQETVVNLEQDLVRMNQENNTQRLQMQRMQSQLRKVQGKGGAEADKDLGFLRTQVHGQQVELRSVQKALDDAREHSAVLEDHLAGAKDSRNVLEERIEQQVAEISDLQKELKDAEGQRDMLLELMQSSDHMTVEEVQNLCNRLEESVAASTSELSDRLQGEQAARKKLEARYHQDVGELKQQVSRMRREVETMERALASERVKSVHEPSAEEELRAKEEECEALREALELVRDEGLIPSGGASSRGSGAHKPGQQEKEANNLHVSQLMGAQASLEGRLKEREREVMRVSEERDSLAEQLSADRKSRQRLLEENRKNRTSVQDLEAKVRYLMGQIKSLVYPRHKDRDHLPQEQDQGESYIQAASEEKMERYLQTPGQDREEYVGEMIYDYEEQIHVLQRQFVQQLSEQVQGL